MTLYDYFNAFSRYVEDDNPTDKAIVLYWAMLNTFNRRGWPRRAGVDNQKLMLMCHTTDRQVATRARDVLCRAGFLEYKPGKKGKATEYGLLIPQKYGGGKAEESTPQNAPENEKGGEFPPETAPETAPENAPENAPPNKTKSKSNDKDFYLEVSAMGKGSSSSGRSAEPIPAHAPPEAVPVAQILLKDGSFFPVTAEMESRWREAYPAVDVRQELREMALWCENNPRKRKTQDGAMRFIGGWLAREQDRRGNASQSPQSTPYYARNAEIRPDGSWEYNPGDTSGSL